jgi:hypothetical protein
MFNPKIIERGHPLLSKLIPILLTICNGHENYKDGLLNDISKLKSKITK